MIYNLDSMIAALEHSHMNQGGEFMTREEIRLMLVVLGHVKKELSLAQPEALSAEVRTLLLEIYQAEMCGCAPVTDEGLERISRLLGIEAFGCSAKFFQCSKWCGVDGRCPVTFAQPKANNV